MVTVRAAAMEPNSQAFWLAELTMDQCGPESNRSLGFTGRGEQPTKNHPQTLEDVVKNKLQKEGLHCELFRFTVEGKVIWRLGRFYAWNLRVASCNYIYLNTVLFLSVLFPNIQEHYRIPTRYTSNEKKKNLQRHRRIPAGIN
jgi:hypothetical protein